MKISACMIIKNEEQNIEKCIKSYIEVVDEIIVVDTGSTDRSVEIAKSLGAKVYFFEWKSDFSAAKNYAISKVSGEWIIFLDADEFFAEGLSKNIPQIIKMYSKQDIDVILCKMYNIDEDTKECLNEIVQARLFRNSQICYKGKIHESLISKIKKLNTTLVSSDMLCIYHTGYSETLKIKKSERNIEMLLKELDKTDVESEVYYHLSRAYSAIGNYNESIRFAQKFLSKKDILKDHERGAYYTLISDMIFKKSRVDEVEAIANQAIHTEPNDGMPYMLLGQYYIENHMYNQAIESLESAILLNKNYEFKTINFVESRMSDIYTLLGNMYEIKGDFKQAQYYYENGLEINCFNDSAILSWLKIFKMEEHGNVDKINRIYNNSELNQILYVVHKASYFKIEYFLDKYNNDLKEIHEYQDFSIVMLMLIRRQYVEASGYLFEIYKNTQNEFYLLLIWIGAYISDDLSLMEKSENLIENEKKNYLKACRKNEFIDIKKIHFDWFWELVKQFYFLDKRKFKKFSKWICEKLDSNTYLKREFYLKIKTERYFDLIKIVNCIDEKTDEGLYLLGVINYLGYDFQKAEVYFKNLLQKNFDYEGCNSYLKWINVNEKNIDENNSEKDSILFLIQKAIQEECLEDAKKLVQKYEYLYGIDAEYYSIKGIIDINNEDYESALVELQKGLDLEPENFDLNYNIAYLYDLLGENELSIIHMNLAKNNCKDEILKK